MADGNINITVQTENDKLQEIIDTLNTTGYTTKELNKAFAELKETTTVGSQAFLDMKAVQGQLSDQLRASTGYTSTFTQSVKDARQEHRLYMFAVMEGIRSLDAFGLKNKEVTSINHGWSRGILSEYRLP